LDRHADAGDKQSMALLQSSKLALSDAMFRETVTVHVLSTRPVFVRDLIAHFTAWELGESNLRRSYSTKETYRVFFRTWVEPWWGHYRISEVRTIAVENWLDQIPRANGTKAKIRNIMSGLFTHALRHEWLDRNPIRHVRQSAKRRSRPDVLEAVEIQKLIKELEDPYRTMVLLAAGTGLRIGELLALKWKDLDIDLLQINLERGIFHQVVGGVKTEASEQPVPIAKAMFNALDKWRKKTEFDQPEDWIFASPTMRGQQPYWPDNPLRRHVRPAARRCGIAKRIGWHTFRHSFATLLKDNGEDIKVVQEALRHADVRTTMNIYAQAVPAKRRKAQNKIFHQIHSGFSKE
jgi:integrase